jgi:hypothetical protein
VSVMSGILPCPADGSARGAPRMGQQTISTAGRGDPVCRIGSV